MQIAHIFNQRYREHTVWTALVVSRTLLLRAMLTDLLALRTLPFTLHPIHLGAT